MMKVLMIVAAIAAVGASHPAARAATPARAGHAAHAELSYAPADSADSLWRVARERFADGDYDRAAGLFARLHTRYPKSAYAGDAFYYEAYSLYQLGGKATLRRALASLDTLQARYAASPTAKGGDARALALRIRGSLAREGDASSAAMVARAADVAASAGLPPAAAAPAVPAVPRAGSARTPASAPAASAAMPAVPATPAMPPNAPRAASAGYGMSRGASSDDVPPGCKSEDDDERVEALNALLQMDSESALPILKKVLARRDTCAVVLRRKAVWLVSQKRNDETADILLNVVKTDPDAETRKQAVFWLSAVGSEKALPLLEQLLKTTTDPEIQESALFSIANSKGDRAQQILRDYASRNDLPASTREKAIFHLGQRRSEENGAFLRQLYAKLTDDDLRDKVLFSIAQSRTPANIDWLLDQAVNPKLSTETRKSALFWAGQSGAPLERLAGLYDKSTDRDFREQVIFTLSQRKTPAALDKLIDIARNEKDRDLRSKAVFWLGQSRDPRAIKVLQELIER